jgi:hypothetical protein
MRTKQAMGLDGFQKIHGLGGCMLGRSFAGHVLAQVVQRRQHILLVQGLHSRDSILPSLPRNKAPSHGPRRPKARRHAP